MNAAWLPGLDPRVEAFVRTAYGILLLLTLVAALPHARRYFRSERWGGYAQRGPIADAFLNPWSSAAVLTVWIASACALAAGVYPAAAAVVNVALCWAFFVRMRWQSVLRGMGAPGFIAFWLGAAVCLLEVTRRFAPGIHDLSLWVLQVDFALIMMSAGIYKLVAGYRAGFGMDLGMVNPEWGYWPSRWNTWRPGHPLFRFLNEMAWSTEVAAGALMLVPATRPVGALLIFASFVFIATEIRLGFLCEMVLVCCLLFLPGARLPDGGPSGVWQSAAAFALCAYVALLPLARGGLYYNQLSHRRLPAIVQRALDLYANLFGLIIWRVFSADVVDFFVRVWEAPADGPRRSITDYEGFPGFHRFRQVAECIAITSVFTTLRYYASNRALFVERLLRYARTIPHAVGSKLVFEWVAVQASAGRFEFVPAAEFVVDVHAATVVDVVLDDRVSVTAPSAASPLHEATRPGSYAPLRP